MKSQGSPPAWVVLAAPSVDGPRGVQIVKLWASDRDESLEFRVWGFGLRVFLLNAFFRQRLMQTRRIWPGLRV